MKTQLTRRQVIKLVGSGAGSLSAAALLAACGAPAPTQTAATAAPTEAPKPTEPPAATEAPKATEAPVASAGKPEWTPTFPDFKKYDPPVKISTIYGAGAKFVDGVTYENNPYTKLWKEKLGIEYTIHWQADGDVRRDKLKADIAAGSTADMFQVGGTDLAQLIEDGAVEDITDIWEKTASALVKEKKGYPDQAWWIPATVNGRIYGVPFSYGPPYNIDNLGHIRQDFLEKVNMPAPTTIEELDKTIRAFKDQKLAPYGVLACKNLVTWYCSLDPIFGAYGVMPTIWRTGADGKLAYGSIQPGVKDALTLLATWYKDGLLDPDFYTRSEGDTGNTGIPEGKAGVYFGPWWSRFNFKPTVEKNPEAKFSVIPEPKGPGGQGRVASAIAGNAVVFKKGLDPRNIEAAINHLNWQVEMRYHWDKYQQYGEWRNGGVWWEDGYEIKREGDKLVAGPLDATYSWVDGIGFAFPNNTYGDFQTKSFNDIVEWSKMPKEQLNIAQEYLVSNPDVVGDATYYGIAAATAKNAMENEFLGNNTAAMTKALPDLQKMEQEAFIAFIIGNRPLDEFDKFVEEWKSSGGDTVTADVNAWKASLK